MPSGQGAKPGVGEASGEMGPSWPRADGAARRIEVRSFMLRADILGGVWYTVSLVECSEKDEIEGCKSKGWNMLFVEAPEIQCKLKWKSEG